VIAHGVQRHEDNVFHAFKDQFENLSEDDFVSFWCIYLTSLAQEQFIKGDLYQPHLRDAATEIGRFRQARANARIPEIGARKSLKEILAWALQVLRAWAPRLRYKLPRWTESFPEGARLRDGRSGVCFAPLVCSLPRRSE
jgi:hypothetical protein